MWFIGIFTANPSLAAQFVFARVYYCDIGNYLSSWVCYEALHVARIVNQSFCGDEGTTLTSFSLITADGFPSVRRLRLSCVAPRPCAVKYFKCASLSTVPWSLKTGALPQVPIRVLLVRRRVWSICSVTLKGQTGSAGMRNCPRCPVLLCPLEIRKASISDVRERASLS